MRLLRMNRFTRTNQTFQCNEENHLGEYNSTIWHFNFKSLLLEKSQLDYSQTTKKCRQDILLVVLGLLLNKTKNIGNEMLYFPGWWTEPNPLCALDSTADPSDDASPDLRPSYSESQSRAGCLDHKNSSIITPHMSQLPVAPKSLTHTPKQLQTLIHKHITHWDKPEIIKSTLIWIHRQLNKALLYNTSHLCTHLFAIKDATEDSVFTVFSTKGDNLLHWMIQVQQCSANPIAFYFKKVKSTVFKFNH